MPSLSRNQLASLAQQARLFRVAHPWQEPCAGEEVPGNEAEAPAGEGEGDEDSEREEREEAAGEVEKDLRAGAFSEVSPVTLAVPRSVQESAIRGLGWLT